MIVKLNDPQIATRHADIGDEPAFSIPAAAFSPRGFRAWANSGRLPRTARVSYSGGKLHVEDLVGGARFSIPKSALSPVGSARWAFSGEYPEYGKVEYIGGEIFIDMASEALNTHAKVKLEITRVIANLAIEQDWGQVYPDRSKVVNKAGDLSNEPEACFCSWESLRSGRVREVRNEQGEAQWLEGSVDWTLEIVSNSSVRKDSQVLLRNYFLAGVREYWLIDARGEKIEFQVFTRGRVKFVPQQRRGGWIVSPLFQRKFSLQRRDYSGFWRYDLLVAPLPEKNGKRA